MTGRTGTSQRGAALVEFALMFPLFLVLFLGVLDISLVLQQAISITEAAHAGAEYGAADGNLNNLAGMQLAAQNVAKGIPNLNVQATNWCACSPGGPQVSCASSCATYGLPIQYVQVNTSASVSPLVGFSALPASIPLNAKAILRVQ